MKINKRLSIILSLFIMLFYPLTSEAWFVTHHKWLAEKAESCIPLPKPLKKRCVKPVDDLILKASLRAGSIAPDVTDGSSSTKHAFNPEYRKEKYDPSIKLKLNMPNAQINAGTAIQTIEEEIGNTKGKLNLNCDSGLVDYSKLWFQFGRLSHYPSDLAIPLHVYSVGVDDKYHEGDINDFGDWYRGLWDLTNGRIMHTSLEFIMGAYTNFNLLGCSVLAPIEVSRNARGAMKEYKAKYGTGYKGLIEDFFLSTINFEFFQVIGQKQAKDAVGGIISAWQEALSGFKPPTNCEERLPDSCEDSRTYPGGDYPDDSFSVSTLSPLSGLEELLEQSWDRLAVKKQKKSLIWYWMQEYLLEEYYQGNIDEATYQRLSGSYGLTADEASEFFYDDYIKSPDVAILGRGFALSMSDLLQNKIYEPVRRFTVDDFSPDALKDYPIMVIPSGGLMGLENSKVFKVKLDEYVKQGGTLIVFAQQHGYEFSILPVPQEADGSYKTIGGYGWGEDQSCFVNGAYIDTWHQILAGQSKSTPNLHLDGYFTTHPSNSTVVLRRTANAQPALLMYEYGQGQVIVTSMYSDFAFKQNQASSEEIALVRDMINWAKKPDELPGIKPGETVSVSMEVKNITTNDAVSVKFLIYNPNRSTLLSEQIVSESIPGGQSATIPITYTTTPTSALGIYHIDYTLMDVHGNIIQPQAETDSGRFVVSNPPQNPAQVSKLTFSIQSDSEHYFYDSTATFTIIAFNSSNIDRTVTAKYDGKAQTILVPANGSNHFIYLKEARPTEYHWGQRWGWLWVQFYEGGIYLSSASKPYQIHWPSVNVTVQTDKTVYGRGETVAIKTSFKNNTPIGWQANFKTIIQDTSYRRVFEDTKTVSLSPYGALSISSNFPLPTHSTTGTYTVSVEVRFGTSLVSSSTLRFELTQSQVSITPNLPPTFISGDNAIFFDIKNTGKIDVTSGTFDVSLKDPEGDMIYSGITPFSLAIGEGKSLIIPISIPSLKFGHYILTYTQSDETRTGSPTNITIPNSITLPLSLDKLSYKVRETANLKVVVTNTGKFHLENVSVRISGPSINYTDTRSLSLGVNQNAVSFDFAIPIPETISAGWHGLEVAIILPSGASITKNIFLIVPEPTLVIEHKGATTLSAGDFINITVENTGGVDSSFTTEKVSIKDSNGVEIYSGSVSGFILSGEKKSLSDIPIHPQTMNGTVFLSIQVREGKTGKVFHFSKQLSINGLTATLQTKTEKDIYFKPEAITGLSRILNDQFGMIGGNLNLVVRKSDPGTADRFLHFLPIQGWWPFYYPRAIAVGPDSSVYVVDSDNQRIQKFDSNGNFIKKWGTYGFGDGEFAHPTGIAAGPDGSVYVSDTFNNRIQKFDNNGNFITKWGNYCAMDMDEDGIPDQPCEGDFYFPRGIAIGPDGSVYVSDNFNHRIQKFNENGNFILNWGQEGSGEGDFRSPQGIAVGSDGSVYVVDRDNGRIQKFNQDGLFVSKWGSFGWRDGQFYSPSNIAIGPDGSVYVSDVFGDRIQKFDENGVFKSKWGKEGGGNGEFSGPEGISVGRDGSVYVSELGNNRVQKFDCDGRFLTKWGSGGSDDGQFLRPDGVATDPDGFIYVADTHNHRIQKFNREGDFITKWGNYGWGDGQFYYPINVAISPGGFVFVVDYYNHRIQKFDPNGQFIAKWGDYCITDTDGDGLPDEPCDGQFYYPIGIAISPDGSVYVSEIGNNRIQRFDSNGNFITKWGNSGIGDGEFRWPYGIGIGPDGVVFVTDNFNNRIQKFDSNGNFIAQLGSWGREDGQFSSPRGIAVAHNGSVYVVDSGNNRIQRFDSNGGFIAKWGSWGSEDGEFHFPGGIAVSPDSTVYVADTYNNRIQKMRPSTLYETILPINQPANTTQDYITDIGRLNATGKLYLEATLKNSLKQTIAQSSYPFYIIEGDTVLLFNTDKKVYRLGERVMITGQVENRASIEAVGLTLTLNSKLGTQNSELVFTETFNIPAGGSHPFNITTPAGAEGTVTLTGAVSLNNSTLVEIQDQYEVAIPKVSVTVTVPEVVGNEEFPINVEMKNAGKVEAAVQFGVQSSPAEGAGREFGDSQTITLSAGETRLLQYQQQIRQNMDYIFTLTGDLELTLTKMVHYGLGASIQFGVGSSELGVFPEGNVAVPVTLTNTGQMDESLEVAYQLNTQNSQPVTVTKTYYLPKGGCANDTLYFSLNEGNYQISANSQLPNASAQANFSVRKENQVEMAVTLGTQTDELIPVNVNLTNLGFNEISGSVIVSVSHSTGEAVWNGGEPISQLLPQSSQLITLNINPSAIEPGNYNLQAQLLNNSNQLIAVRSLVFGVRSANFQITQLPSYQTFYPGQEAIFIFRVKNTGNQEGSFDLRLKSYDLIDSTQREWLKTGEEKAITFNFMLPEDLEEKDYFATYELKNSRDQGGWGSRGQIKYHLAGISLNGNASLDKPCYSEGETAHLTINIQSNNPNPQPLSARVNYAGFESQQTFTLNGSQVLIFNVPLPQITGEKLFYGIYHESGRSIHLNSLYIHKAGDVITVTTDKQVYNPGEVVSVSVTGNASGNMSLSGPGGYEETFTFSNQANKSFVLPSTLTAGTYLINVQLVTPNSELIATNYPFDVAGIQVKVLECNNDKGKYASSDTIATSFTISSNTTILASLKVWIVDPTGQYTSVGEQSISLSSSENSLITHQSLLATSVSGIHRLVYGVYAPGSGDPGLPNGELLLVSGSEAFDVGDAVLLGLSTNKRDYPTNTEPVIVTVSLFGSVNAELQLELDGNIIKSESISLNGFMTFTTELQNLTLGPHTLKAILTAGGLKCTKETSFTYALAFMPNPQISASPAYLDFGNINLGSASTQTITLSSTGNADSVIGMIALSGTNQGEFNIQNDGCSGRTISPSGTCTIDILFSPTSLGAKGASLSIPSNATATPTLFLPLSGTGVTTLNLNISINPMGGGRVIGTGIDCPGDCVESFSTTGAAIQLTATPTEGYRFVNWTGDINLTDNPVTVDMDTNKNVTANFITSAYTIHATAGIGGTISPSGLVKVNSGGSPTFTIMPSVGYHVADVKADGVSVGAVLTYTFSNVTSDHTIEAIFAINQYTITATVGSNGAISPSGTLMVNYGESQTFTITPDAGYHVADVKVDGASMGAMTTFTFHNVTSNHTIEATFAIDNRPPVANAGPDLNVITGQAVTLNGSDSFDPEGAMITFLWTFIEVPSGSSVTDASLSDVNSAKPQFTPDVRGAYRLKLIVNDGALDSVADEMLIHAYTSNVPPNANAGPDQNVYTGNTVLLDGSRSSDPDNGPLPISYLWSFTAQPAGSVLTDHNLANRNTPNASFIPDVSGLYELRLTVSDGQLSSEDTVQIMSSIPNVPPNANAGVDRTFYLGDTAGLDGSASNDPDHGPQPLTFLWSFVTVPTGSRLTNGAILGANTVSPSFTPDVAGTYVLALMVYDGRDAGFDNVAVTVLVDNTPPTLAPVPDKTILWPPNHKMVDITIWANAADNTGRTVALSAVVSSNEPQDGLGDGDTSPDWTEPAINQIKGIITLKLRAERSGRGNGRIYTITITARDASDNRSRANVEIRVPLSR